MCDSLAHFALEIRESGGSNTVDDENVSHAVAFTNPLASQVAVESGACAYFFASIEGPCIFCFLAGATALTKVPKESARHKDKKKRNRARVS